MGLLALPFELLGQVLEYVDRPSLLRLGQVCRQLRQAALAAAGRRLWVLTAHPALLQGLAPTLGSHAHFLELQCPLVLGDPDLHCVGLHFRHLHSLVVDATAAQGGRGATVTDSSLAALAELAPNLHTLQLAGLPYLTDGALTHVAALTNLHVLHLPACRLQGPGLAQLVDLARLEVLSLRGCSLLDGPGLALYLDGPPSLLALDLGLTGVTSTAVATVLPRFPRLEWVGLQGLALDGALLQGLQGLHGLATLLLDDCWLAHSSVLDSLAGLGTLHALSLANTLTWTQAECLAAIACLPALRVLQLGDCPADAGLLGQLSALTGLQELGLEMAPTTTLAPLQHMPALRALALKGCANLGDTDLGAVVGATGLTELQLGFCRMGPRLARSLAWLKGLRVLGLASTAVNSAAVNGLSTISALHTLLLDHCSDIEPATLHFGGFGALRHLSMAQTRVSPADMATLPVGLTGLVLDDCRAMATATCLGHLRALALLSMLAAPLRTLHGLQALAALTVLACSPVGHPQPRDLQPLAGLRRLGRAELVGAEVQDGHLAALLALPALRTLTIDAAPKLTGSGMWARRRAHDVVVTARVVEQVGGLPMGATVQCVRPYSTHVVRVLPGSQGEPVVLACRAVEVVHVLAAKEAGGRPGLRELVLRRCGLCPVAVVWLGCWGQLAVLELADCPLADCALLAVAHLPCLLALRLPGCSNITGAALAEGTAPLREVDLGLTGANGAGLAALGGYRQLARVVLDGCQGVDDEGLLGLARATALVAVSISHCRSVTGGGTWLQAWARLPGLQQVVATHSTVDPAALLAALGPDRVLM